MFDQLLDGNQMMRIYNRRRVSGKEICLMWMRVSICTSTLLYDDEWGHKLMSLTYCTYLFLCVTMTHYAWMGMKHPHRYQKNALHGKTK